ncbi:MAPEG family protein [Roseibium sp.]|uniref:MAPEG family protein n=1 Tax=Roseibium sp. TaxID=1936156 RepID=UPI003D0ACBC6
MPRDDTRKKKFHRIILAYPFVLAIIALAANSLVFGVFPVSASLPAQPVILALIASLLLLLANHTWLMTSTELTRLKYGLHATPEEWDASASNRSDVSDEGIRELERRHNAHANATENTVHFALLAFLFSIVSPPPAAAITWLVGFSLGRLGHTWSYLAGMDNARGLFMSISLTSLYGLAGYLAIAAFL